VQQLPQPIIAGQANVDECLIKRCDRAAVHLLVPLPLCIRTTAVS
jgi:hypothetical protein